jgi:predicted house-cleaning noncanonical NTP pyrophosphatase (MazG superfamily)
MKKPAPIIYNKLVRDRIPEIIGVAGKEYFIHTADPDELRQAIGKKLLEEAGEFHEAWQDGEPKEILKEAADVLEVLLTGLEHHEMGLEELIAEKNARAEKRGGFGQGIMLESVHLPVPDNVDDSGPRFISTRLSSSAMTDTIVSELEQSDATAIASAFYAPGQTNILVSALDRFVALGWRGQGASFNHEQSEQTRAPEPSPAGGSGSPGKSFSSSTSALLQKSSTISCQVVSLFPTGQDRRHAHRLIQPDTFGDVREYRVELSFLRRDKPETGREFTFSGCAG